MTRSIRLVCLAVLLSTAGALAEAPDVQTDENVVETTTSPVAHVYIGSGTHIVAFSAAANGKLTAIPGSPFNYSLSLMGANGHYLFGFEPSSVLIDSLSMAANGALKKTATTNTEDYWPLTDCPLVSWNGQGLRIDHSGEDLYNAAIPEDLFCYSNFQSFKINGANGKLTYLGESDKIFYGGPQLSILGNNEFAYSPNCAAAFGNSPYPTVTVFQRLSSGELSTVTSSGVAIPAAPMDTSYPGGPVPGYYCPVTMATDPANHAAMTLRAFDNIGGGDGEGGFYGPMVIATFTADARGNLKTTSTYKNMAVAETGGTMRMSPSGKLLAVGGSGLEIFHFNGGSPLTKYKTLLTTDGIGQILWDNANHMYALGGDAKGGKLWVYTVTPTSVVEAPGSPYSITNTGGMVVQPLK